MPSDVIGRIVGNYRVIEKIGDGGMGSVYLARHVSFDRSVAIKVLHSHHLDDPETRRRFFNEARAAMQIRHPGIVRVFDCGEDSDGSAYIIMEFLEGEDLSKRISNGRRVPITTSMLIGRQVVEALAAAHDHGIVHRDLKPDNLFMVPDPTVPGGERIKILDFGIAKLQGDGLASLHKTQTGAVMGTPTYMSPEQCRGTGVIDHRSDLYAVGCILFRLMCGRIVFREKGYGELLAAHIHLAPPRPSSIEPAIPPLFENIILKLLAKRPDDRYQSAIELLHAMDEAVANTHLDLSAAVPEVNVPERRRASTGEETRIFTPGEHALDAPQGRDWVQSMSGNEPPVVAAPRASSRPIARTSSRSPGSALRVPLPPPPPAPPPLPPPRPASVPPRSDSRPEVRRAGGSAPSAPLPLTLAGASVRTGIELISQPPVVEAPRVLTESGGVSTTLRGASGDMVQARSAVRGISWVLVGMLASLAVGAVALVVLYVGRDVDLRQSLGVGREDERPGDTRVILRIETTPPGASVVRPSDAVHVGVTPYEMRVEAEPGLIVFRLQRDGYMPAMVTLPMDESRTEHVTLVPGEEPRDADTGDALEDAP